MLLRFSVESTEIFLADYIKTQLRGESVMDDVEAVLYEIAGQFSPDVERRILNLEADSPSLREVCEHTNWFGSHTYTLPSKIHARLIRLSESRTECQFVADSQDALNEIFSLFSKRWVVKRLDAKEAKQVREPEQPTPEPASEPGNCTEDQTAKMLRLWIEGHSMKEIARMLCCEEKTVRNRISERRQEMGEGAVPYAKTLQRGRRWE